MALLLAGRRDARSCAGRALGGVDVLDDRCLVLRGVLHVLIHAPAHYRTVRRTRGRFWHVSQAYVPRPAATNFTISVPQRTHGSPRRRCTWKPFWNAPWTPSGWRKSSIDAPPASIPAASTSCTAT